MSNKTIIEVSVQDEKFKSFVEAFNEWRDSVDDAPAKWDKLGEAMGSAGKGLEGTAEGAGVALAAAAASADDLAGHLHTAAHAQSSFAAGTRHSLKGLNAMKGAAHDLGKTLFGIGKFLAGGIVMGGIGTALGGFGMADLAGDAMNRQRRARSLGVSTGMASSFEANFMRVGNPAGMLQNIANAKNTLTDQPFLKSITGQIHGDTATMAYHAMLKAHDTWKSLPASARNTTTMNALGYSELGFTLGDMRVLARTKKSTLESDWAKTQKDQGSMALGNKSTRELSNFYIEMKKAGVRIESFLVKDLGALGPSLQSLTKHVVAAMAVFASLILTKANVKAFGDDIQHLADFMGTKQFQSDLIGFGKGVGLVASEIIAVAHKLEWLLPTTKAQKVAQQRDVIHGEYERAKGTSRAAYFKQQYDNFNAAHPVVTVPPVIAHGAPNIAHGKPGPHAPLGIRQNNPGDLRWAPGDAVKNGFASFHSKAQGVRATMWTLAGKDYKHDHTLAQLINTYAPPGQNNTAAYLKNVSHWSGIGADQHINMSNPQTNSRIVSAILREETSTIMTPKQVRDTARTARLHAGADSDRSQKALMAALARKLTAAPQTIHIHNSTGAKVAHSINAASLP